MRSLDAFLSRTVDRAAVLGGTDELGGFTAGSGSAGGDHDISTWTFEDDFARVGAPLRASFRRPPRASTSSGRP